MSMPAEETIELHPSIAWFWKAFSTGSWAIQVLHDATPHMEALLVAGANSDDPEDFVVRAVTSQDDTQDHADTKGRFRLNLMLANAIVTPSENTSRILKEFDPFIRPRISEIRRETQFFARGGLSDIRSALAFVEPEQIGMVLKLTGMSSSDAITVAIAWDDSNLLHKLLEYRLIKSPPGKVEDPWERVYPLLAKFSIDPKTRISQAMEEAGKSTDEVVLSKLRNMRGQLEMGLVQTNTFLRISEVPAGLAITPTSHGFIHEGIGESLFYLQPAFAELLGRRPYDAVTTFFLCNPPDDFDEGCLPLEDAIGQAFMDAGVSAHYIITHGIIGYTEDQPLAPLARILRALGRLKKEQIHYYSAVHKAYFSEFDAQTLVRNCSSDQDLLALHQVTRNKDVLRLAGHGARDALFGSDLGL